MASDRRFSRMNRTFAYRLLTALTAFLLAGPAWPGPAAAQKAGDGELRVACERTWPAAKKATRQLTEKCAGYWLRVHGGFNDGSDLNDADLGPYVEHAAVTRFSSAQLRQMARHVEAARGALSEGLYANAHRFFDVAARCHFSTLDLTASGAFADHRTIVARLETVLDGKPLDPTGLRDLSPMSLSKLRNAVYARHGRRFKSGDLNAFFYGEWKDGYKGVFADGGRPRFLPRKQDPAFADSALTAVDHQNVAVIKKIEARVIKRSPTRLNDELAHLYVDKKAD